MSSSGLPRHHLPGRWSKAVLAWAIARGRILSARRYAAGRPRSFWGVTPILTLPLKARCDRLLGIRSETIVWNSYRITRNFDLNLRLMAAIVKRISPRLLPPFARLLLAAAILRYDIFHYFLDRGLLWPLERFGLQGEELEALRAAGKKTLLFAYGADIRTRERTLALGVLNFCRDCPEPGAFCICDDAIGSAKLSQSAKLADAVVTMADMGAYAPMARHCDYWPIDTERVHPRVSSPAGPTLVVAHAPNHQHFKGTSWLRAAIDQLQTAGHAIELKTLSGVSNAEVQDFYSSADIVAEQFLGGTFGYAALEGMALGKPVLSFVRKDVPLTGRIHCPILQTPADKIIDVLRWCLANRAQLGIIGRQGRAYVERHHAIPAVAARLARLYREIDAIPVGLEPKITAFLAAEATRQSAIPDIEGWLHPFPIPPGPSPH